MSNTQNPFSPAPSAAPVPPAPSHTLDAARAELAASLERIGRACAEGWERSARRARDRVWLREARAAFQLRDQVTRRPPARSVSQGASRRARASAPSPLQLRLPFGD